MNVAAIKTDVFQTPGHVMGILTVWTALMRSTVQVLSFFFNLIVLGGSVVRGSVSGGLGFESRPGQTIDHYLMVVTASLLGIQGCGDSITTRKPLPEQIILVVLVRIQGA